MSVSVLNRLFLLVLLCCAVLSACALAPPIGPVSDADFRLRGKIGVRDHAAAGSAFSASFDWIQAGDGYAIELWGPFGQGRTRLSGDPDTLTVTNARGETLVSETPEALMQEYLGWSAPLDVLRHWVQGRLAPGYRARRIENGADGNLARFEQLGWTVEMARWRKAAARTVPGRLKASRQGRRITIICRQWLPGTAVSEPRNDL